MKIAFYIDEMNLRGVANSTYQYALYNEKILKNSSIIFYNKKNFRNLKKVITKFKKRFDVIAINNFNEIDLYKKKLKINYIYTQKGGERDAWVSKKIKTLVHCIYPQTLKEVHGHRYAYISEWLSRNFSNNKIPYIQYIISSKDTKINLRKKLNIKKDQIVFGCHGGESSFDLKFAQDALLEIVKKRKDIFIIFLNINKFCSHSQIKFLKGSADEIYKKKFINTCDAMIYGRSLGESFGLACGEFAIEKKKIISYKFCRHRSHIQNLPKNMIYEYSSKKNLIKIINKFDKKKFIKIKKIENKYLNTNPKVVMKKFNKVFLKDASPIRLNLIDYAKNYQNFIIMGYFYIRHKIYQKYYSLIESNYRFNSD